MKFILLYPLACSDTYLPSCLNSLTRQLFAQQSIADQLQALVKADNDAAQWAEHLCANRPWVGELDECIAGFTDLQPLGYIDQFFVVGPYAGRGLGKALMAQIYHAAEQAGMASLWADVSLCAEPFFSRNGFAVEARQQVEVHSVVLANARMAKRLADV